MLREQSNWKLKTENLPRVAHAHYARIPRLNELRSSAPRQRGELSAWGGERFSFPPSAPYASNRLPKETLSFTAAFLYPLRSAPLHYASLVPLKGRQFFLDSFDTRKN